MRFVKNVLRVLFEVNFQNPIAQHRFGIICSISPTTKMVGNQIPVASLVITSGNIYKYRNYKYSGVWFSATRVLYMKSLLISEIANKGT